MTEDQWRDTKYTRLLFGLDHRLIYIGRAQVPGSHSGEFTVAYRQVCLHAFPREALAVFASVTERTPLEAIEDHEMLRFLELGLPVRVVEMSADSMPVDRPEDLPLVERRLIELGLA
jgi:3-deoxy-manno-octulosonate cytidylyltransferase (CMP-KDO synthetase)